MEETIHDLTAAYALDALEPDETRRLRGAPRDVRELPARRSPTSARSPRELAFAGSPASPPPALRERILEAARAERPNVVPLRPRWREPLVARRRGRGVRRPRRSGSGTSRSTTSSRTRRTRRSTRVPVTGASGSVVVSSSGTAALVLDRPRRRAAGKTYEAWVIRRPNAPAPAGLFRGGPGTTVRPDRAAPSSAARSSRSRSSRPAARRSRRRRRSHQSKVPVLTTILAGFLGFSAESRGRTVA